MVDDEPHDRVFFHLNVDDEIIHTVFKVLRDSAAGIRVRRGGGDWRAAFCARAYSAWGRPVDPMDPMDPMDDDKFSITR